MKGKDILKSLVDAGKPSLQGDGTGPSQRPSGAIKALNLGLNRLSEEAAEAKHLREALAKAENVVEVEPTLIDSSIVRDRLTTPNDHAFEELKSAIAASGQQVPVLLRVHPGDSSRYQAAYGHRRIRAARELGITVKAIIRPLTDTEMVVAQGQENGSRVDLSFIERALFASRLEENGFDKDTICSAIGIDKPELSRLLTVAGSIDHTIVESIGPAPKIGRPRWLQFAQSLNNRKAVTKVTETINSEAYLPADSNERFKLLFAAARGTDEPAAKLPKTLKTNHAEVATWERRGNKARLVISDASFSDFVEHRLDTLIKEFEESRNL